ncbi:uncharacterized protein [Miscanthus floridulus]|uniref:uncharacterized protein n=1 Tax=Miscanthus floridulus TaxID=154761 RepID=UPI003459E116
MKMYLGSINDQLWDVTENDYAIIDLDNLTNHDKANKQCNTMSLNTINNAIDSKVFEQIKDCDRANEVWKRLEGTYEGSPAVKSAKLYIFKYKLTSFKMKKDESILEMFHRLQVIVNDLKALGGKIKDDDVSYRFLMCLPDTRDIPVEREGVDKDDKKEDEDNKKKSIEFKASSSFKNKGKLDS